MLEASRLGSLLVLYDCWKMGVMMGGHLFCSRPLSLKTLAGSSSGPVPVALFWLRFCNCLIIPFVPI